MARSSARTKSQPVCIQACLTKSRDKLLTDAHDTLVAFNGRAFAVRFSRSAIFFISEVTLLWKKKKTNGRPSRCAIDQRVRDVVILYRILIKRRIVAKKFSPGIKIVTTCCRLLCYDLDCGAEFFGHDAAFYQNSVQLSSLTFRIWHEFLTFGSCFVCTQGCVTITRIWVLFAVKAA